MLRRAAPGPRRPRPQRPGAASTPQQGCVPAHEGGPAGVAAKDGDRAVRVSVRVSNGLSADRRIAFLPVNIGAGERTRTADLLITNHIRDRPARSGWVQIRRCREFRVAGEGFGTYCSCRDGNAARTGAAMNALRGDEARAARLPQVACMPNGAAGQRVGWGPQCTGTVLSWRDGQRRERVPSSLWTRMSNSCSLRSQRDALRWTSSAS